MTSLRRLALGSLGILLLETAHACAAESAPCSGVSATMTPSAGRSFFAAGPAVLRPGREALLESDPPMLAGSVGKGRKKHVLLVTASLNLLGAGYPPFSGTPAASGGIPLWPVIMPIVNGTGFGAQGPYSVDCGGSGLVPTPPYCYLSATWWMDLDQAEAAFPGRFLGKPLCVALVGRDFTEGSTGTLVDVSLTAFILRK